MARSALRQVGHLVEGGDAVAIDPSKHLPGAEPLEAALLERGFERRALELGEVHGSGGMSRRYLIRFQRFAALSDPIKKRLPTPFRARSLAPAGRAVL